MRSANVSIILMMSLTLLAVGGWCGRTMGQQPKDEPPGGAAPEPAGGAGLRAGDVVTVYFRGDVTGTTFNDRLPQVDALATRRGTVERAGPEVLVLREGATRYHIPKASIAMVETGGK